MTFADDPHAPLKSIEDISCEDLQLKNIQKALTPRVMAVVAAVRKLKNDSPLAAGTSMRSMDNMADEMEFDDNLIRRMLAIGYVDEQVQVPMILTSTNGTRKWLSA
jgi:hypothetical protein